MVNLINRIAVPRSARNAQLIMRSASMALSCDLQKLQMIYFRIPLWIYKMYILRNPRRLSAQRTSLFAPAVCVAARRRQSRESMHSREPWSASEKLTHISGAVGGRFDTRRCVVRFLVGIDHPKKSICSARPEPADNLAAAIGALAGT